MRVLVTGAGGFIGSHVAKFLCERGHAVTGVWHDSRKRLADLHPITLVRSDLRSADGLPDKIDAIVHCAFVRGLAGFIPNLIEADAAMTRTMARYAAAAGARYLIYMSSVDVYGAVSDDAIDERTPIGGPGPYGRAKLRGEEMIAETAGVATLGLRLPGVVGRSCNGPWIARLAGEMATSGTATVFNPDAAFNNSLHVDDICRFVARVLDRGWPGHEILTVAAAAPIPVRDVVRRLRELKFPRAEMRVAPSPRHSYTISIRKAVDDFGFEPMTVTEQLQRYAGEICDGSLSASQSVQ